MEILKNLSAMVKATMNEYKFRERIDSVKDKIPEHVLQFVEEELTKLKRLEVGSTDIDATYNYLDLLTVLPWECFSDEYFDVTLVHKIIDGLGANKHQNQEPDVCKRLELMLELVKKQVEINTIQEMEDEHFLSEKIRKRIEPIKEKIPKHVLKIIKEELGKLNLLEEGSIDFKKTYDYLHWLTVLPWKNFSDENFDVLRAEKILEEDHYGLSNVKERILELIAVGKLRGTSSQGRLTSTGKIICLSGPPGVGKTSIASSIARALGRKFFRLSVGELSHVEVIKGVHRSYEGALPGTMVQCLKSVGTSNPLVLIDEIDKIGRSSFGDIASVLLEVMDPEQNAKFRDHYLDVTVDLSKVLFVCTANEISMIPEPLQDRMEMITIAGYTTDDKVHIARDHLMKTTCRDCGIKPEQAVVSDAALHFLIENYCREAGVRNLQKHIDMIYRKIALKLVRQGASAESSAVPLEKVMIDESNLADYVGKPVSYKEKIYEQTPVGVVMGLAWTSMGGGSPLYIETTFVEEVERKGCLRITGHLGDVMKESAEVAHTVAKKILLEKEPKNPFFANSNLHLHVPEGATPKEGPSAGCTMITSLLSLAMKKHVRKDLAMTGEVTLTGRILPIGGVKEKTMAARRSQVKMIIFPEANRKDFDELPVNMREGLDVQFVDEYEQIFELAFGHHLGSPRLNFRKTLTSLTWDLLISCFQ